MYCTSVVQHETNMNIPCCLYTLSYTCILLLQINLICETEKLKSIREYLFILFIYLFFYIDRKGGGELAQFYS